MEESVLDSNEFLQSVKTYLSGTVRSKFPAISGVIEKLVIACDEKAEISFIVSHLSAIRHYIKVKEGLSVYRRQIKKSKLE